MSETTNNMYRQENKIAKFAEEHPVLIGAISGIPIGLLLCWFLFVKSMLEENKLQQQAIEQNQSQYDALKQKMESAEREYRDSLRVWRERVK